VAGQANITQDQYVQIVLAQLTQLWSNCMCVAMCMVCNTHTRRWFEVVHCAVRM
jgi:hypothetical protein